MESVFDTLNDRGFITQTSDDSIRDILQKDKVVVYAGFDPTADSLQLGNLVPLMALSHMQRAGHQILVLMGGATALIGDPSDKDQERELKRPEEIERNIEGIEKQLVRFLDFDTEPIPIILNNHDWIGEKSIIYWLREVGKNFKLKSMIRKEFVQSRLESESGISFTEFSYITLQAYDFLHLHEAFGCTLQIGGNEQWGNITAGIDLIHRLKRTPVYGLTHPLITTADGEKFGKSAGNAVWLDPARTTPWDFFQYLVRREDEEILHLLKIFTFLPMGEIKALGSSLEKEPEKRAAHKALATELTAMVHGRDKARDIARAADTIYYSEIESVSEDIIEAAFAGAPSVVITRNELNRGIELIDVLLKGGLVRGKGDARRLIKQGSIYVNNSKVDAAIKLFPEHLASESLLVLRRGKKSYLLVRVK